MEERFSIANVNYILNSNIDVDLCLSSPQAYSLHTNYGISAFSSSNSKTFRANIIFDSTDIEITLSDEQLYIRGNLSDMFADNYNQQFSLWGNKGILNHYILHTLELQGIVALHGCSVIHPLSKRVLIGLGASGQGKSAFITAALRAGWDLMSTELVLVDDCDVLYSGNYFDNVSPVAYQFVRHELSKAFVFDSCRLVEPVAERTMVSFREYMHSNVIHHITQGELSLVILSFGNRLLGTAQVIIDNDFLLRVIQYAASEKICSPTIFGDRILPPVFHGDVDRRTRVVKNIAYGAESPLLLGGGFRDIQAWLTEEYRK